MRKIVVASAVLAVLCLGGWYVSTQSSNTAVVQVFFHNRQEDPNMLDCEHVYPVERRVDKNNLPLAAVEELLRGPTAEEESADYFTLINPGVVINSLSVEKGVARIDFDEQLQFQTGGSCRVMAIRAQIKETLLQFSEIDSVVISIEGESEYILQP